MESATLLTMNASQRRQNETVNREVIQKITQGFVELDLDDPVNRGLSAVMDYVFYGKKPRVISQSEFKSFVTEKLKCPVSDQDLKLFFIANPVLAKARGDMISEEQLLDVFQREYNAMKPDKQSERPSRSVLSIDPLAADTADGILKRAK